MGEAAAAAVLRRVVVGGGLGAVVIRTGAGALNPVLVLEMLPKLYFPSPCVTTACIYTPP